MPCVAIPYNPGESGVQLPSGHQLCVQPFSLTMIVLYLQGKALEWESGWITVSFGETWTKEYFGDISGSVTHLSNEYRSGTNYYNNRSHWQGRGRWWNQGSICKAQGQSIVQRILSHQSRFPTTKRTLTALRESCYSNILQRNFLWMVYHPDLWGADRAHFWEVGWIWSVCFDP